MYSIDEATRTLHLVEQGLGREQELREGLQIPKKEDWELSECPIPETMKSVESGASRYFGVEWKLLGKEGQFQEFLDSTKEGGGDRRLEPAQTRQEKTNHTN